MKINENRIIYAASLMKTPKGTYTFVGTVPLVLAYTNAEMTKSRTFKTLEDAKKYASELRFTDYQILTNNSPIND